jgi:hypothetical protein
VVGTLIDCTSSSELNSPSGLGTFSAVFLSTTKKITVIFDEHISEPTLLLHLLWYSLTEVTTPSRRWHVLEIDERSSEGNPSFTHISRKRGLFMLKINASILLTLL